MTDINLNLEIEDERWLNAVPDIKTVAENVKSEVFSYVAQHEDIELLSGELPLEVNVCLSDDKNVHSLNKEFRNMDKPTNVLSFANIDFEDFEAENNLFGSVELGDIIIAYETMCREAEIEKISLKNHFCHLLAHGFLHILGFDHIEEDEAQYMESFEIAILQNLGIDNPYREIDDGE